MMPIRLQRKEALANIRTSARGTLDALADLFECELADAHAELETAQDEISIWRAQGRVMEIKSLVAAITREG